MMRLTFTARVRDGKLATDKPVELPDGTQVDVVIVAGDDDRAEQHHREALLAAVAQGLADSDAGRVTDDAPRT